jgi:hypothetical protein
MENEINIPPFYVGQPVVAVAAPDGSRFKNGQAYTVSAVEYRLGNKSHPIGRVTYYWYVGIVGFDNGGAYFAPRMFAPMPEAFQSISLEEVLEVETPLISSN